MSSKNKTKKVELEWNLLERISEFYEFPVAVFLGNLKMFPECKTRNELLEKKAKLYDKIKDIVAPRRREKWG